MINLAPGAQVTQGKVFIGWTKHQCVHGRRTRLWWLWRTRWPSVLWNHPDRNRDTLLSFRGLRHCTFRIGILNVVVEWSQGVGIGHCLYWLLVPFRFFDARNIRFIAHARPVPGEEGRWWGSPLTRNKGSAGNYWDRYRCCRGTNTCHVWAIITLFVALSDRRFCHKTARIIYTTQALMLTWENMTARQAVILYVVKSSQVKSSQDKSNQRMYFRNPSGATWKQWGKNTHVNINQNINLGNWQKQDRNKQTNNS